MAAGDLALVLHAHLPYVRSSEPGSLEEDWYFQALQECDLPLLAVLEAAIRDAQQAPRFVLKTVDRPQCMSTHQDFILIIRLALRFAGCSRMLLSG